MDLLKELLEATIGKIIEKQNMQMEGKGFRANWVDQSGVWGSENSDKILTSKTYKSHICYILDYTI